MNKIVVAACLVFVCSCFAVEVRAADLYRIAEIVVRGEPRDSSDAAIVLEGAEEVEIHVGMELYGGDTIRVWVPGVRVRLVGDGGDTFAVEHGRDGPADYTVGEPDSCWQRAGKVTYGVFERAAETFECLVGPEDRAIPLGVEGTRFSVDVLDNGLEVTVADGVVVVGEPGSPLHRRIENGRLLRVQGDDLIEEEVDRETVVRVRDSLVEVTVRETEGDATGFILLGDKGGFERRTVETVRVVRSTFGNPDKSVHAGDTLERYRQEGVPVVDAFSATELWTLADALFEQGDFGTALEIYTRAHDFHTGDDAGRARLKANLGICALELGDLQVAEQHLLAADEVVADDYTVLAALVDLYQDRRNPRLRQANEFMDRLLAVRGRSALECRMAGRQALDLWRFEEAAVLYEEAASHYQAVEDRHGLIWSWIGLGDAVRDVGRYDDATRYYQRACDLADNTECGSEVSEEMARDELVAHERMGTVLCYQGRTREGLEHYRLALAIQQQVVAADPDRAKLSRELMISYENMGDVLADLGETQQALEYYEIAEDIADLRYRIVLASELACLRQEERTDGTKFSRKRKIDPPTPELRARTGRDASRLLRKSASVHQSLGLTEEAIERRSLSLEIMQWLASRAPDDVKTQLGLGAAHLELGNTLGRAGDSEGSLAHHRSALQITQQLVQQDPCVDLLHARLATHLMATADVMAELGMSDEALEHYERCLEIRERLSAASPHQTGRLARLANTHSDIGIAKSNVGLMDAALDHYRRAIEIRQGLAAVEPERTDFQLSLAHAHRALGTALEQKGRTNEALVHYQLSLEVTASLVETEPERSDFQGALARSAMKVGWVHEVQGESQAALEQYLRALEIRGRLVESSPSRQDYKEALASAHCSVGEGHFPQGLYEEGISHLKHALALRQAVVDADPLNTDSQRVLAVSHGLLGYRLEDLGEETAALTHYHSSAGILARLAEAEPDRRDFQYDLAISLGQIGYILRCRGELDEALGQYGRALTIRERLVSDEPDRLRNQVRLTISYEAIGELHEIGGDLETALEHYLRALSIREGLVEAEPARTDLQWRVSQVEQRIGNLQESIGDRELALGHHGRGLAILQALTQAEPDRTDFKGDLAWLLADISAVQDPESGEASLAKAVAISGQIVAAGGAPPAIQLRHGHYLLLAGRLEEAREHMESLYQRTPETNAIHGQLAGQLAVLNLLEGNLDRVSDYMQPLEDEPVIRWQLVRQLAQMRRRGFPDEGFAQFEAQLLGLGPLPTFSD